MRVVPVVMIAAGMVLIWAAVTDRNPIDAIKAVLSGKDIPESGSLGKALGESLGSLTPGLAVPPANDGTGGEIIEI